MAELDDLLREIESLTPEELHARLESEPSTAAVATSHLKSTRPARRQEASASVSISSPTTDRKLQTISTGWSWKARSLRTGTASLRFGRRNATFRISVVSIRTLPC